MLLFFKISDIAVIFRTIKRKRIIIYYYVKFFSSVSIPHVQGKFNLRTTSLIYFVSEKVFVVYLVSEKGFVGGQLML